MPSGSKNCFGQKCSAIGQTIGFACKRKFCVPFFHKCEQITSWHLSMFGTTFSSWHQMSTKVCKRKILMLPIGWRDYAASNVYGPRWVVFLLSILFIITIFFFVLNEWLNENFASFLKIKIVPVLQLPMLMLTIVHLINRIQIAIFQNILKIFFFHLFSVWLSLCQPVFLFLLLMRY